MAEQSRLEIVVDSRRAERNLRNVRSELQGVERTGVASMSSLRSAALAAAGAFAAIGVSVGVGGAIRQMADFEASINGLSAVSGAVGQDLATLENQARTLGATSQFSAQQAAEGQRFLAQAGFEVNEILGATPGILQLATAAQIDLASAADIASNVLGGMGLEVSELARVNDVLAATASSSNTNITQLGDALSYAAPFARAANVSLEEAAAAIGVMSDAGIQGSRAGTGLLGVIRQLSNVTPAAEEALSAAGLSIADVNIEARGLQPVLMSLRGANLDSASAIKIFGSEAGAAAQVLVSDYQGAITGAEGESQRMADTLQQGLSPAFRSLGSAVSEATLQMGDSGLAGGLETVVRGATGVVSVFNGMTSEFQAANDVSDDYISNVENIATAAQLAATAVGVRLATALGTATTAKIRDTAASIANARAEATAAQQVARRTGAELASARAMLSSNRLEEQATRGTAAHAFALNSLSAARVRATNAAGAHATATTAATAAMGRASVAARTLSASMALVGGPVGAALITVGALITFREELGLMLSPAQAAREEMGLLAESIEDVNDATIDGAMIQMNAKLFELERRARETREELDSLSGDRRSGALGMAPGATGRSARLNAELGQISSDRSAVTQEMERLQALRDGLDEAGESGSRTGDALERLGRTADDVVAKFKPMLNQDVEDVLERAGPGATIDEQGRVRDAFGNLNRVAQRELEGALLDQRNDFQSEQNLQAGLNGLLARMTGGSSENAPTLLATNSQDSAPARAGKPMGTFTIKVAKDGEADTEGTVQGDEDFIKRMASALGGVASAV